MSASNVAEGFIDGGDRIVVAVRGAGAREERPARGHARNVWIYEFSDGKLIRGRVYADTAIVRHALAGLPA